MNLLAGGNKVIFALILFCSCFRDKTNEIISTKVEPISVLEDIHSVSIEELFLMIDTAKFDIIIVSDNEEDSLCPYYAIQLEQRMLFVDSLLLKSGVYHSRINFNDNYSALNSSVSFKITSIPPKTSCSKSGYDDIFNSVIFYYNSKKIEKINIAEQEYDSAIYYKGYQFSYDKYYTIASDLTIYNHDDIENRLECHFIYKLKNKEIYFLYSNDCSSVYANYRTIIDSTKITLENFQPVFFYHEEGQLSNDLFYYKNKIYQISYNTEDSSIEDIDWKLNDSLITAIQAEKYFNYCEVDITPFENRNSKEKMKGLLTYCNGKHYIFIKK